jgi:DNA mismatch endonuclease (patch repair protein)
MTDTRTPEQRSRIMSAVRGRNTSPELALRRALYAAGVRGWRCHYKRAAGTPDLAWPSRRLAVFVDGAFWHGHPDVYHGQSGPFWDTKIAANRARDARVNDELAGAGWTVVRLWDFEVEREPVRCAEAVARVLRGLRDGDAALAGRVLGVEEAGDVPGEAP